MLTYVSIRPQPIYSRPFRVSSNSGIERSLLLLPRHIHPLQPRLRTIAAAPLVENRDPKPNPAIASFAPQPKLPIEDEHIRRQPMPPLQKARKILDTTPTRTAHHDYFMPRHIAQPQPPIPFLSADQKRKREARVARAIVKTFFIKLEQKKIVRACKQQRLWPLSYAM